jgi:ribosome maturation factor RimP
LSLNATLEALVAPIIADLGYALVRVQMNGRPGSQTLQIMAEDPATGQLTLAQCSEISRALDEPLDAADPIEGEYALEVSSPGIDRPLTRPADWTRWAGHEVRLKLSTALDDGPQAGRVALKGTIIGLDDIGVQIDVKDSGTVALPLGHIASAKLVLTNKLIAATRPLDAGDADETIDEPETDSDFDNDN